MKIEYLQISNILSFKHYEDISISPKISFDEGLNILIGQNGSGKSTALEIINLLFKKVMFLPCSLDQDLYNKRNTINFDERKRIIKRSNDYTSYKSFRLDPNWDTQNLPQIIRCKIKLDEVDKINIDSLINAIPTISSTISIYSSLTPTDSRTFSDTYIFNITLNHTTKVLNIELIDSNDDFGFDYLTNYNFYKESILLFNIENPTNTLEPLKESFTIISSYRNYHTFQKAVSLKDKLPVRQLQDINTTESNRSLNAAEKSEPSIFGIVKLRVADVHFSLITKKYSNEECEEVANNLPFLGKINEKLKIINLKCRIKLLNHQSWQYTFEFFDLRRNKVLDDINSLSAGQKSITHLVFEAYGRGELKGLVIIDEPEIHLHYQFQHVYLRVIEELNNEQNCQYILVTHSESLINSNTIDKVKRFTLHNNHSEIKAPKIEQDQKTLIKILDNTRSTYAFFSKKIVLVEGDTDRYFFKAVLDELYPDYSQEVAIIDIGGKGNYKMWREFFEEFGLYVYYIGDFDNVFSLKTNDGSSLIDKSQYESIKATLIQEKLNSLSQVQKDDLANKHNALIADPNFINSPKINLWFLLMDSFRNLSKVSKEELISKIKTANPDIEQKIDEIYSENIFILKRGSIESYIGNGHGNLNEVVEFCLTNLASWIQSDIPESIEIKYILENIINHVVIISEENTSQRRPMSEIED